MTTTSTFTPPGLARPGNKRTDLQLARRLLRELLPYRATVAVAVFLYLPLTLTQLAQPWIVGRVVDKGYRHGDVGAIGMWTALFIGTVIARVAVESVQLWLTQRLGQRAVHTLRAQIFAKIQRLPTAYFDRTPLGKVMTRVTNDTENVSELFSSGAISLVGDVLFLVGTLIMLLAVNVQLSLPTLLTLPLLAIGVQWFRVRARTAFGKVRTAMAAMNGTLQELISGMAVVQLFAQGPRTKARFAQENQAYMDANREAIFLDAGVFAFVDAVGTLAVAVALAAGAALEAKDALTLGVLVTFVDALGRFFMPIRELSNKTTLIQSALVAADRIVEIENEPEDITRPADAAAVVFERALRFDNVRFRYGDGPEILKGLNFEVKKGQRVAIVGHTGAGKSTIVKLVPRLYDVSGGSITLDGVDIRRVDPRALRLLTTAVPQEVFLFAGTVRDNLSLGLSGGGANGAANVDAVLQNALQRCQADGLLARHGGLDAKVEERGQNFSLGERQLLALVRALVTNPPILILDEATASVDRQTERLLQVATEELLHGRTAIIIAHRLSTIEKCDRIFVLHQGELVEEGTHAELLALGGRYKKLVDLQKTTGG